MLCCTTTRTAHAARSPGHSPNAARAGRCRSRSPSHRPGTCPASPAAWSTCCPGATPLPASRGSRPPVRAWTAVHARPERRDAGARRSAGPRPERRHRIGHRRRAAPHRRRGAAHRHRRLGGQPHGRRPAAVRRAGRRLRRTVGVMARGRGDAGDRAGAGVLLPLVPGQCGLRRTADIVGYLADQRRRPVRPVPVRVAGDRRGDARSRRGARQARDRAPARALPRRARRARSMPPPRRRGLARAHRARDVRPGRRRAPERTLPP